MPLFAAMVGYDFKYLFCSLYIWYIIITLYIYLLIYSDTKGPFAHIPNAAGDGVAYPVNSEREKGERGKGEGGRRGKKEKEEDGRQKRGTTRYFFFDYLSTT